MAADSELRARKASAASIRSKHPDRIPVIVDKRSSDQSLPDIDKKKFLVPADLTVGQFMYVIRKRVKLAPEQAIFLFVAGGTLPPSVNTLQSVYDEHQAEDGFLYMTYSGENFFGFWLFQPSSISSEVSAERPERACAIFFITRTTKMVGSVL